MASVEGGSGGAPSGAAAVDEIARSREFAQCMRDNGVAMEDPDPGTGELDFGTMRDGADSDTLRTALEACRDKAPQAIQKNTRPDPEMLESMRKFAQCMRDGGVPVNDPGPEGLGKPFPTDAPGFDAAMEKCQGLLRPGSGK
ncbi:hypothetical protein [Yinghuangia sp. YIM S09857]|uniref:hypothetical protein n=1 Tax=Yinghuangia sp. YIM S09857 TaxID=3436929 RepID=UPI003F534166